MLAATVAIHPDRGPRVLIHRVKLLWRLARARPWFSRLMQQDAYALLRQEIERHPQRLGILVWPYIHAGWTPERRVAARAEHMRLVLQHFPWLALGAEDRREVLSLNGVAPGLRLELDRGMWFQREGEVVFNLFQGDNRLMSVPFTLAHEQGDLIAYVGGLQGSNRPDALEVFRELTKALNGLRPRDFAVKAFQLFAGALGVTRVLCVADEHRHHRHAYFGNWIKPALRLNYDEAWGENGGQRLASGFFQLAVTPVARPLEEVPVRKRAMYRRRFEMMAELDQALRRGLKPGTPAADPHPGASPVKEVTAGSPEPA